MRKGLVCVALLWVIVSAPLHATDWRNAYVLLIGNSSYDHAPPLDFVANDLAAMQAYAQHGLGVPQSRIKVLHNTDRHTLSRWFKIKDPDQPDSADGLLISQALRAQGHVLVYYSGHGVPDKQGKPALLPVNVAPLEADGLFAQDQVVAALKRLKSQLPPDRHVIALFDSCFSGQSRVGELVSYKAPPIGLYDPRYDPGAVGMMTAASGDLVALSDSKTSLSGFTSAFLRAVSGQADDPGFGGDEDGRISSQELERYIRQEIAVITGRDQKPESRLPQPFSLPAYTVPHVASVVQEQALARRWSQEAFAQTIRPGRALPSALQIMEQEELSQLFAWEDAISAQERKLIAFARDCQALGLCPPYQATLDQARAAVTQSYLELQDQRFWLDATQKDRAKRCLAYQAACQRMQATQAGYACLHTVTAKRECLFVIPPEQEHDQGLLDQARTSGARADWQACAVGCKLADNQALAQTEVQRLDAQEAARLAAEREAQRQAQQNQDDRAWQRATAGNTVADYRAYVRNCQLCSHKTDAQRRMAELSGPKVGETFRDCPSCPLMTVIPAGSFMMGSNEGDDDEKPVHEVQIRKPFAMGVYEVTFDEWEACVSDGYCQANKRPGDERWGRGQRPVINVSWDDITASGRQGFITWLNSKVSGSPYRLPSEAEWEYAARAGSQTKYWWGNGDPVCKRGHSRAAKFHDNAQCEDTGTETVGFSAANPFGLYDVHGNVWEWVQDCWNGDYKDGPQTQVARTTGGCNRRVLRGGSWFFYPGGLRSTNRLRYVTSGRDSDYGFRITKIL